MTEAKRLPDAVLLSLGAGIAEIQEESQPNLIYTFADATSTNYESSEYIQRNTLNLVLSRLDSIEERLEYVERGLATEGNMTGKEARELTQWSRAFDRQQEKIQKSVSALNEELDGLLEVLPKKKVKKK